MKFNILEPIGERSCNFFDSNIRTALLSHCQDIDPTHTKYITYATDNDAQQELAANLTKIVEHLTPLALKTLDKYQSQVNNNFYWTTDLSAISKHMHLARLLLECRPYSNEINFYSADFSNEFIKVLELAHYEYTKLTDNIITVKMAREDSWNYYIFNCADLLQGIFDIIKLLYNTEIDLEAIKKGERKPIDLNQLFVRMDKNIKERNLAQLKDKLASKRAMCETLLTAYRDILRGIDITSNEINRIEAQSESFVKDGPIVFKKYIDKNIIKNVDDSHLINDALVFEIETEVFNYNELAVKNLLKPLRSELKPLYTKIFIESEYQMIFRNKLKLDFRTAEIRRFDHGSSVYKDYISYGYMSNPHITMFNCFGQNGPTLVKALKTGKWEELIAILLATIGNINFADSVVVSNFNAILLKAIENNCEIKFIKNVKTNTMLTINEFLKEVKDNENTETK